MQLVLQRHIATNKNERHSDVAHFTTHGSNLSCEKSGCCKKAKLLQKVENSSICFLQQNLYMLRVSVALGKLVLQQVT